MGFFDLNIPYPEPSPIGKASLERQRTKTVVKAMELGYTGIAYNRTIKGVMSDSHRCCTPPLTLSSLLKVAPALALSVKLHRDLLGIPSAAPFRQYTRLTVCVDNSSQAQALNSGNPILKTYDLVAVRPLNQTVFDQACERMEVDMISMDFSGKLPFRLKQPMVKAAVERGICFEIIYSGLITDTQIRRQLISNAKLLVDWTRGRNIILSSAAPSANELRGPYDVVNLSSLLGLSKEKAKAAISTNCRTLLTHSLRKKQFYKEAIKVEALPPGAQSKSEEGWHKKLLKWDPISSGEGDLQLDDIAKLFSLSCNASKTTKAIDFDSAIGSIPSHGFQVGDFLSASNPAPSFANNDNPRHVAENVTPSTGVINKPAKQSTTLYVSPELDGGLSESPTIHHAYSCDNLTLKSCKIGSSEDFEVTKEINAPTSVTKLELKCLKHLDENPTYLKANTHEYQSDKSTSSIVLDGLIPEENEKLDTSSADAKLENAHNIDGVAKIQEVLPKQQDTVTGELMALEMNQSTCETSLVDEQFKRHESEASGLDKTPQNTSDEVKMEAEYSIATEMTTDTAMEDQKHIEGCLNSHQRGKVQSIPGKSKGKRGTTNGMHLSPFKRLLNPMPFKKKAQKMRSRTKLR